jgi:hypothetical protein
MKKLKKLTLAEMGCEMALINPNEMPSIVGGSGGYPGSLTSQDVWNWYWTEVESGFSYVTNAVGNVFNTIEEAKNDFTNWVDENNIMEAMGGLALTVADVYLWWLGTVPVGAQSVINPSDTNPSDTGSDLGPL